MSVPCVCSDWACLMTGRYNYRTRCIDTYIGRAMMDLRSLPLLSICLMRAMRLAFSANGIWATIIRCAPWTRVLRNRWCFVEEALGSHPIPWVPKENTRIQPLPQWHPLSMKGYCTDLYFDHALSFMQQAKARNRPFFVYLPTNAPHGPFPRCASGRI